MNCYVFFKMNCLFDFICMLGRFCCLLIGIQKMRSCFTMQWLILYFKIVDVSHMITFDLISLSFNCCLRIEFGLFIFSDKCVVYTNLSNLIFKGCGNRRNMFFFVQLGFIEKNCWFF